MPPNSKKGKKKSKSKQHTKKGTSSEIQAKLYDEANDYPTSRVIKRAPNGDVIVESLPTDEELDEDQKNSQSMESPMAFTLDSHWESLEPEEKKSILRIEKDEVFDVIRNYQNSHNCNCSVCGRRHMAMDQEMERIYNTLYDLDRERDPEINPIKFHLSIIKELQNSKVQHQQDVASCGVNGGNDGDDQPVSEPGNIRDDVVKYFLSSNAVDSLKEEVMHFKQNKQQQQILSGHGEGVENDEPPTTPVEQTVDPNIIRTPSISDDLHNKPVQEGESRGMPADNEELQAKYLKFAKTFVSSHPKIAKEYVSRMMMYPDMRALTDDLMNNNGQGFVKAIESFVAQKQGQLPDPVGAENSFDGFVEAANIKGQSLGDAKEFTTMLHNGKPLTPEEYANLQRHVADRMTNSYDAQRKEFKEVSQLERELFTRFMFGEDRKRFGDLIMQSFREKFDDQYSNAAIGASLAAAAATTVSPIEMPGHDEINEDYDFEHGENDEDEEELDSNEYDESYDDYSDYGDEDEIEQGDEEDEIRSDLDEENDDDEEPASERSHRYCAHDARVDQQHTCHEHKSHVQDNGIPHGQQNGHYHPHHEHDEDFHDENDKYESSLDEADRLEEGRKLIQIAITKLLQGRIMESYHEKQAENNRLKLLQELEAEELKKKAKEEKKHKKREKEKEKKKAQQIAKEEEKRRKEEEAEMMKKEAEEREKQRREAQRKKVEEVKRKKDEERRRKLEEQRRREEEQERHRKIKEEQKRKRDEERRLKDEERKRLEEGKRQKEEELKLQEQLKLKADEEKRLQEERATENQTKMHLDQAVDRNIDGPSSQKPLFTSLQYSTPSPNMPYGNNVQPMPSYRSNNVNDDILNMVSSATASKPVASSSGLQTLLDVGPGIPHDAGSQPLVSNGAQLFGPSSLMPTGNYPGEEMSYNNMPCMMPPVSSSRNSASSGLGSQNFGLSSWNSYGSNPNLMKGFHQAPLDLQREQRQHSVSAFGTNNTQPANEEYLAEEMNNIANMLSSAGLQDPSTTSRAGSFGQLPLWGSQRDRSSISIPNSLAPRNTGLNIDANPSSEAVSTSEAPITGSTAQHSSIWDEGSKDTIPTIAGEVTPMANKSRSATFSSSIWGPTHMSFLDEASDVSNTPTAQTNVENKRIDREQENKDSVFVDSIYKTYLAFTPSGSQDYVPTNTIHQNSLCCTLDYPSFISYLLSMHTSHNCDLLTSPAGSITHVRMSGPQNEKAQSSSRDRTDSMMSGAYFNQPETSMPPQLNETNSALGNGPAFGPQYFNLPHSMNHSSLTSNIWG